MEPAQQPACASWEALGTNVLLRVCGTEELAVARAAVERELAAIDLACSRFREDSELARVNAGAGRPVRVGPVLIEALEIAIRAAQLTEGDVDPTVGAALELAGYDRDWRALEPAPDSLGPPPAPIQAVTARLRSGWRTIAVDSARSSVRVPRGVRLDLGATAKAWAADRSARAAAEASGVGVLVGVGGDMATCGAQPAHGWLIRVTDDHRSGAGAPGQTITIRSGGLATSSTSVRRWAHEGRSMHHIIDPATGAPVRDTWRTVSVAAGDCTDANIAATAALVRASSAPAWLAELGLPARLVDRWGRSTTVGGWPAGENDAISAVRRTAAREEALERTIPGPFAA
jgi:thiamine biosynthesis lipoprotein